VEGVRAILLRAHAYSESSQVLRFLTDTHGVVGVMARGIRKGSRGGTPDLFGEVALTLYIRPGRDLQTLKEFSTTRPRRSLGTDPLRLAAASVLSEVVLRHHGEGASQEIFTALSHGLDRLGDAPADQVLPVLLREGWGLVSALGFHPQVDHCVVCGSLLDDAEVGRFDFDAGGVRCPRCLDGLAGPRVGPGARAQLEALLHGEIPPDLSHIRQHLQLLSDFMTYHVAGGRPLDAFRFLAAFLPVGAPAED
jgi:DNA repair protein RecO (recombination protein O)